MCALPGTLTKLAEVRIIAEHVFSFINIPVQENFFANPTERIISVTNQ
jgi:hypothetical protein